MVKVFVDGSEGTTGLQIHQRLANQEGLELLVIESDKRKDMDEKKKFLNAADIVFLCLPDEAARNSVALIDNSHTKVIDASTAHRTTKGWAYGIPELSKAHRSLIESSSRVANPGCHASAVNLALYPLVEAGLIAKDYPLAIHALTGYSGGGNRLIEKYENTDLPNPYHRGPRHYGLNQSHKHLAEIMTTCGLTDAPIFNPIVGNFYKGLVATIPLKTRLMNKSITGRALQQFYSDYYQDSYFVKSHNFDGSEGLFDGCFDVSGSNDTNFADLFVYGNDKSGNLTVMCRLDNLGKGASGAAVQNMNLLLGRDEWTGLLG